VSLNARQSASDAASSLAFAALSQRVETMGPELVDDIRRTAAALEEQARTG